MATFDRNQYARPTVGAAPTYDASIDQGLRSHMLRVYNYMSIGLLITALAAFATYSMAVAGSPDAAVAQTSNGVLLTQFGAAMFSGPMMWLPMIGYLGLVFWLRFRIHKMSVSKARSIFFGVAALMGIALSSILLVYTAESIVQVFLITAVAFGGLSLFGYTTKKDLTGWGSFLIMGVIGIFIAMIVNIFLQSSALMFAISVIGVLVFAGLTAYDTQKIKEMYYEGDDGTVAGRKAVYGALTLYIDFVMMFQFLLMLLGNRE